MKITIGIAAAACLALGASASADIIITQGASAPTYSSAITFDEVGGPTGFAAPNSWSALGVSSMMAGDGGQTVDEWNLVPGFGWLDGGYTMLSAFGLFMNFDSDISAWSAQIWDAAGPPDFFGGGLGFFLFNDGQAVYDAFVAAEFFTPAWGGVGDQWFNISSTDGTLFDEVRVIGFGFDTTQFVDDISWEKVPAPGSVGVLALGGLLAARRRR